MLIFSLSLKTPRSSSVRLSPLAWCGVAVAAVAPWIVVMLLASRLPEAPPPTAAIPAAPRMAAPRSTAPRSTRDAPPASPAAGPWGQLNAVRIVIEPPEDFVPDFFATPQPVRWTFSGFDDARLAALWEKAALTPGQRAALSSARCERSPAGIILHPPAEIVLGLSAQSRAVLYTALAASTENAPQHDPFRVRADAVDDWFDQTRVPADVIALTRRLLYPRNNLVLFSDADLVLPRITDTATRLDFIKNLSRKSTLLVHLQVTPQSDIEGLTQYWGHGSRRKDVRPLLQSLARRPGGGELDIVHLLPAFARSLIYTYPLPSTKPQDAGHDCHWTSFNFFNRTPDERFADINIVREALMNDYYPVGGPPRFGDLIVFLEAGGKVVHSCIYIAADIVFTKNGVTFSTPWQFGQLEPLVAFYTLNEGVEIRRYRARER